MGMLNKIFLNNFSYYPIEAVGPLLLIAAGVSAYCALIFSALHNLNKQPTDGRFGYILLGTSLGLFVSGLIVLMGR